MILVQLEAPPQTNTNVATTPTTGKKDFNFSVRDGLIVPINKPSTKGPSTSCATDCKTPIESTTTTVLNILSTNIGIATIPSSVVDNVHATERATSPPASNANRLDA